MPSKSTARKRRQVERKVLRRALRSPEHEATWSGEMAFEGFTKLVCEMTGVGRFKLRLANEQLAFLVAELVAAMPKGGAPTELRLQLLRFALGLVLT